MSAIFVKQPNGLYCRYSNIVDCVTDYNLTEGDVKERLMKKYEQMVEAEITEMKSGRNRWNWDFQDVIEQTEELGIPNGNMTREEFNKFMEQANKQFETKEE